MPLPLKVSELLPLRFPSRSIAAFNFAIAPLSLSNASMASRSASGESGIVSKEEIEGDRDRNDVGVLGIEDAFEEVEYGICDGNASLNRGDAAGDVNVLRVGDEA